MCHRCLTLSSVRLLCARGAPCSPLLDWKPGHCLTIVTIIQVLLADAIKVLLW